MTVPRICDMCMKTRRTTRFGWRYHDMKEVYRNSGLGIIYSESYDLCAKCLEKILKIIKNNIK